MAAEGDYTTQELMTAYAGTVNLEEYATLDGTKTPEDIEAGVQSGIDMAEAFTNRLARVAGFETIPIPDTSADFAYLQSLVTKLAIAETYFKRGRLDNLNESSPQFGTYGVMSGMYKQARADLEAFFASDVDGETGSGSNNPGVFQFIPVRPRCATDEYSDGVT